MATDPLLSVADESPLAAWFRTQSGQRLCELETEALTGAVRRFHGETMLWLGPTAKALKATDRCMVKARFYGAVDSADVCRGAEVGEFMACPEALPFPTASIDGIVVHHALELARDPRAAIREINRVLRSGGRLLVCAFNPWSVWSLERLVPGFRGLNALSSYRLHDWLAVLGLVHEEPAQYLNYRGPLPVLVDSKTVTRVSKWINSIQLPFGGVYITVATKQTTASISRPLISLKRHRKIEPVSIPRPTARQ